MAATDTLRVVTARVGTIPKLRDLVARRELIASLVRKELKVKYKNSSLGFVWTVMNPAMYLLIFWLVFTYFLPNGIPSFAIFLLCGLLPWNMLSNSLVTGVTSVTGNGALVKKIWFPREVLPVSSVGAALVHFGLQAIVLAAVLIFTLWPVGPEIAIVIPATLTLVLMCSGFAILLSAINVKARDTQHLLELAILLWFWMTPIVYPVAQVQKGFEGMAGGGFSWLFQVYLLNPMTPIVLAFQRGIYGKTSAMAGDNPVLYDAPMSWYLWRIGAVALFSFALFYVAMRVFARAEADFAEEL